MQTATSRTLLSKIPLPQSLKRTVVSNSRPPGLLGLDASLLQHLNHMNGSFPGTSRAERLDDAEGILGNEPQPSDHLIIWALECYLLLG